MVEPYREFHDFLLDSDGELRKPARALPKMRRQVQALPETAASFTRTDVVPHDGRVLDIFYEFLGAWRLVERYGPSGASHRYVNPQYQYAHRFSDVVVECQCGATFVRNYEDEYRPIDSASEHADTCVPHWRLRARAEMSQRRHQMLLRLGWLGWKGTDMGHRFGVTRDHTGAYARDYHLTLRECYEQYREAAANTCAHLVTRTDVGLDELANIYGHTRSSVVRWLNEYTEYEAANGGGFSHDPAVIPRPETADDPEFVWDADSSSFVER